MMPTQPKNSPLALMMSLTNPWPCQNLLQETMSNYPGWSAAWAGIFPPYRDNQKNNAIKIRVGANCTVITPPKRVPATFSNLLNQRMSPATPVIKWTRKIHHECVIIKSTAQYVSSGAYVIMNRQNGSDALLSVSCFQPMHRLQVRWPNSTVDYRGQFLVLSTQPVLCAKIREETMRVLWVS